jgi:hypothetical protein
MADLIAESLAPKPANTGDTADTMVAAAITTSNGKAADANLFAGKMGGASWLYVVVALIGGIIGGALSNRLAVAIPALAADSPAKPTGDSPIKSIAAQEILLVDAKGKPRASLHLNDDGLPVLQMVDGAGKNRLGIGFFQDGTLGMEIADDKGTERALLSVGDDEIPALRLFDDTATARVLLGVDMQGDSAVDFYDHDGKVLRELP